MTTLSRDFTVLVFNGDKNIRIRQSCGGNLMRDNSLDFLRGLAIISVILIHTAFWTGGSYVPSW